ncbi:hypothetical protein [Arthrobacter globiformis]|uniref:hypothetical protein n=1 Tax=Arthrobacter globiformis TaxID=1665 RepID=UPI0027D7DE7D|nr:hypothetical protein [Arthrobacter globiformis]
MTREKIGSVEQVFTSGDSAEPVFVTVRTGLFGMSESFAPLSGASLEESVIRVAFAKDTVKNGPRIDSDRGAITETQEQELYSYYGLDAGASNEGSSTGSGPDDSTAAAGDAMLTETTADSVGEEGRIEATRLRAAVQRPPHPLQHGGPPAPPPHLRKHVPRPPGPHPGPHPPHRPPRRPGGPIQ